MSNKQTAEQAAKNILEHVGHWHNEPERMLRLVRKELEAYEQQQAVNPWVNMETRAKIVEDIQRIISPMWRSIEAASIQYFLQTGTVNGSFLERLIKVAEYGRGSQPAPVVDEGVVKNAPDRIYLSIDEEAEGREDFDNVDPEQIYWSKRKQHDSDIEYVRAGSQPAPVIHTASREFAEMMFNYGREFMKVGSDFVYDDFEDFEKRGGWLFEKEPAPVAPTPIDVEALALEHLPLDPEYDGGADRNGVLREGFEFGATAVLHMTREWPVATAPIDVEKMEAELICPDCNYTNIVELDSHFRDGDSGSIDCDNCTKEISFKIDIDITLWPKL